MNPLRFIALIVLSALLAQLTDAQYQHHAEPVLEGRTTDFLPLAVGNKWTYGHSYWNNYYSWVVPDGLARVLLRAIFETPGYPYFLDASKNSPEPPLDLRYIPEVELTIEITHTETIGGHTYFVFSDVGYSWPPVPNLFLAGQKVRFSDEGMLLFRWNEKDIPLYAFNPQYPDEYSIPKYPMLQNKNESIALTVARQILYAEELGEGLFTGSKPPPSLSQEISALFAVYPEEAVFEPSLGHLWFVTGYGLAGYKLLVMGTAAADFDNAIYPVSAVIDGQEIAYPYIPFQLTTVHPISWGQLKSNVKAAN